MTDKRCAIRLRCRIAGICLAAGHASGSPLCAYAIAFSTFCVLGLPYLTSRERSRKQKKNNSQPIFVSTLACLARSSLICLSYLAPPSRCVSLYKCDTVAIAMRVRGQIQQKILSYQWRKIDSLRSSQLHMHCKCRYFNLMDKFFQTRHTTQFHRLRKRSVNPERSGRDADVEVVVKRTQRTEFPPIPAAELSPLLRLQDAGPRPGSVSDVISSSKFPVQRFGDANWDKAGDIAPRLAISFHDSGAEISVLLLRHEENRFHAGIEFSVHQRHLKFEFKIGNGSQTSNDRARFLRPCKVDQQSLELGDSHAVDLSGGFSEQIEAFL